jgi:hypothetical protein
MVTANSTKPLFLALGAEFYQEVNGQMYPMKMVRTTHCPSQVGGSIWLFGTDPNLFS